MAELLFLGTGAADWEIKARNGFFRRNSAALLDRKLLLDCGAHIFDFAAETGEPNLYGGVTDILITHNHSDHVCPASVHAVAAGRKVRVLCSAAVRRLIGEDSAIEYLPLTPFTPCEMGGYRIMPVLANHDVVVTAEDAAVHYIIQTPDGKTLFYGLDGAWFLRPSWEEMKKYRFDLMVLDATVGDRADWRIFEHNTIPMLRMMAEEIKSRDMVAENGLLVASHLSRTLHASPEETDAIMRRFGLLTATDGLCLAF